MKDSSRLRITSKDGKTRVTDLDTGEDVTHLVESVRFHADVHGVAARVVMVQFTPDVEFETLRDPHACTTRKKLISAIKRADRNALALDKMRRHCEVLFGTPDGERPVGVIKNAVLRRTR